jgi:hypothetical protein
MGNRKWYYIVVALLMLAMFASCEKDEDDKPVVSAPTPDQLSFTISEGVDRFNPVFTNTSSVKGLVDWELGNGEEQIGDVVTAYYPQPGEYTVKMTLLTRGGRASISKIFSQTETDYKIFNDPLTVAISGGTDALNGKTWVIDSTNQAHLGVGEVSLRDPNWWSAGALDKKAHPLYDDEFTFKVVGFEYIINTKGATHANGDGGAVATGLAAGYYTSVTWENDYDKDVLTNDEARGAIAWAIVTEGTTNYIELSNPAGVIGYDDGNPRRYEILEWNRNFLWLRTQGTANARYLKLIPKGYKK